MQDLGKDNLFLLEFLVDDLKINPQAINQTIHNISGEYCVQFKFLNNPPLDICEADFVSNPENLEDYSFKSGKSVLFSLTSEQIQKVTESFLIDVNIIKKITNNEILKKVALGSVKIQIEKEFLDLLESIKTGLENSAKIVKDVHNIISSDGNTVGEISIFLRISYFGKQIVTQFKMNMEECSILFKDQEGASTYHYKKKPKNTEISECESWERALNTGNPLDKKQPTLNTIQNPLFRDTPEKAYQEIGAEMNGNSITIRVLKNNAIENSEIGAQLAKSEVEKPPELKFQVNGGNNEISARQPHFVGKGTEKMMVTEISDIEKDVFVLRIGKKKEGEDKKSNLELELRTPKGLQRKPPPKLETRATQYEIKDGETETQGKTKSKKRKGKGKKGKKSKGKK